MKYATDITEQKLAHADFEGQFAAIGKAQAVIEFALDGKVLTANAELPERARLHAGRGPRPAPQHVRRSGLPRRAPNTGMFWDKLGRGEFDAGQYKRIGKGGKEVWIQASYNPILDPNGKPFKVVKYATDITEQKLATPTSRASSRRSARRRR